MFFLDNDKKHANACKHCKKQIDVSLKDVAVCAKLGAVVSVLDDVQSLAKQVNLCDNSSLLTTPRF